MEGWLGIDCTALALLHFHSPLLLLSSFDVSIPAIGPPKIPVTNFQSVRKVYWDGTVRVRAWVMCKCMYGLRLVDINVYTTHTPLRLTILV
jgi:hypothetical protein